MKTTNTEKIALVERLLEAKAINFQEALKLLEVEKEYVYQYWPYYQPYYGTGVQPLVTYCGDGITTAGTNWTTAAYDAPNVSVCTGPVAIN